MKRISTKQHVTASVSLVAPGDYPGLLGCVSELLEAARRASARTVNVFMTATYWEVGRRIVEFDQGGEKRAEYGTKLIERLSSDLTQRFGRGFGQRNVECMRQFFLAVPLPEIQRKLSGLPIPQTVSAESFAFYHTEALRGGWSVRQLQRQMDSQFYERTALSRNKAAMLAKGAKPQPDRALDSVGGQVVGQVAGQVTPSLTPPVAGQDTGQVTGQVTGWIVAALRRCEAGPRTSRVIQEFTGFRHRETFQRNYLGQLLTDGLPERTIPDKPNSRLQKYRLTEKGRSWLATQAKEEKK